MKKDAKKAEEKKAGAKVKKVVPTEQAAFTALMRATRKCGMKLVKSLKPVENKTDVLEKVETAFAELVEKLNSIRSEVTVLARFSKMTPEEKEMLKKLLNA